MVTRATRALVIALLAGATLGCFSMPQTAEEFRTAVPGSFSARHRSYELDRSYAKAAEMLRRKAPECFDVAVEVTTSGYQSSSHWIDTYKPTVIVGEERAELHLQQHKKQANLIKPHKEPEGGYYMLVVDVNRLGRDKIKVDIFAPRIGYAHVIDAVDGWLRGTSSLCPDMAEHDF